MEAVDPIEILKEQHRDVDQLFELITKEKDTDQKYDHFTSLADALAIHATLEERHFYPAVKARQTEDLLRESLEEHLAVKRILADLLELNGDEEEFDAKIKVLQEMVQHHVQEEEKELFPKVRKLMTKKELAELSGQMEATMADLLDEEEPRLHIPEETDKAAPL